MATRERFHDLTTGDHDLDRLRAYLSDWIRWEGRFKTDLNIRNSASWVKFMKPSAPAWDAEATDAETFNVPAMQIIDQAMAVIHVDSPILELCLRWRYLNVNVQAHVFRLPRLRLFSTEQLDELADAAEKALLPIVRRKGLVL